MYHIFIDVLCRESYSAMLPEAGGNIEPGMEELLSLILLNVFGFVAINIMRTFYLPATSRALSLCALQMQATCLGGETDGSEEELEARLEDALCCALLERFSSVVINAISIKHERHSAPAAILSCSA
jgi:hypothetical protein